MRLFILLGSGTACEWYLKKHPTKRHDAIVLTPGSHPAVLRGLVGPMDVVAMEDLGDWPPNKLAHFLGEIERINGPRSQPLPAKPGEDTPK